jgi:cellulose biosynthesis protein BcsQ
VTRADWEAKLLLLRALRSRPMKKKPLVPVVAVLNMKGGVGKTTLSANIFRVLFERRRETTLLLDLDPQFNLTQALFTRSAYDNLKKDGKTILPVMEPPSSVGLFDESILISYGATGTKKRGRRIFFQQIREHMR